MWSKVSLCFLSLLLILTVSCKSQQDEQILIGVAAPLTGPNAKPGQDILNGVKLAVEEWNSKGGLLGKSIEILSGDDRSDPREGLVVANKLVNSGVLGVIGHYNSGVSIPASGEVYAPSKVVNITPASTNAEYTERGLKWVFRTIGRDDQQAKASADYAIVNGLKKIAIIHNKGAYGQGLAEEFKHYVESQGGNIILFDGITRDDKDFSPILTKIKEMEPELLFYGGEYQDGALFTRQARQVGVKAKIMGGDALYDSDFINLAGKKNAEGVLITFLKGADSDSFRKAYNAKFGEVGPFSAYAYDAANLLLTAIKDAAKPDKQLIRDKVAEINFPGVTGNISFNPKGDLTEMKFQVWTIDSDGQFKLAKTEASTATK